MGRKCNSGFVLFSEMRCWFCNCWRIWFYSVKLNGFQCKFFNIITQYVDNLKPGTTTARTKKKTKCYNLLFVFYMFPMVYWHKVLFNVVWLWNWIKKKSNRVLKWSATKLTFILGGRIMDDGFIGYWFPSRYRSRNRWILE